MNEPKRHIAVTIEQETLSINPNNNQRTKSWVSYWETRGELLYGNPSEKDESPQMMAMEKATLKIRHRDDKMVTASMRVLTDGQYWSIVGISRVAGRKKYLELKLEYNDSYQGESNRY